MIPWAPLFLGLALCIALTAIGRGFWEALTFTVIACLMGYLTADFASSRPKPLWLEMRAARDATVLWHREEPGERILVMLETAGGPRYFSLPWSDATARQLQQAESAAEGRPVRMGQGSLDDQERMFYPDPQESRPEKTP